MLKCENVSVKEIIENISFEAKKGSFTAILGKNGSGKTTLAKCIMGERSCNGEIFISGKTNLSLKERSKKIAYLPQVLPSPNITVHELVSLGRTPYTSLASKLSENDLNVIENAISVCNLSKFKNRMLPTLSGGEKQRAFLAMLLAQESEILLLDEPCSHLDMAVSAEFCELLSRLEKTVIVIMHDLTLATKFADSLLILSDGKKLFFGSKEECLCCDIIEKSFGVKKANVNENTVFFV